MVNISRYIAVAVLVATTTAGCSSCVKDDAGGSPAPAQTGPARAPSGDWRSTPLPPNFKLRPLPGLENRNPVVDDAGTDATTH
jgi:hypothetical protein